MMLVKCHWCGKNDVNLFREGFLVHRKGKEYDFCSVPCLKRWADKVRQHAENWVPPQSTSKWVDEIKER